MFLFVCFWFWKKEKTSIKLDRTDIGSSISYMIKNIPLNWYTSSRIPEGSPSHELLFYFGTCIFLQMVVGYFIIFKEKC